MTDPVAAVKDPGVLLSNEEKQYLSILKNRISQIEIDLQVYRATFVDAVKIIATKAKLPAIGDFSIDFVRGVMYPIKKVVPVLGKNGKSNKLKVVNRVVEKVGD